MSTHKKICDELDKLLEAARLLLAEEADSADALEANDLASEAISLQPDSCEAWVLKCQALSSLSDDSAALACIEMATRIAPKSAEANYWRAAVLSDLKRHVAALAVIETAFRCLGSDDFWLLEDLYFEKAIILDALGRNDDAVATYELGLQRCPNSGLLSAGLAPLRRAKSKAKFVVIRGGLGS